MESDNNRMKEILIGNHVIYSGTGSAGEVLDVRRDDEGVWVKVDSTQLWYNSRFLELIGREEYMKLKSRKSKRKIKVSNKEDDEKVATKKKVDATKKDLEGVDMSSELCDGGG